MNFGRAQSSDVLVEKSLGIFKEFGKQRRFKSLGTLQLGLWPISHPLGLSLPSGPTLPSRGKTHSPAVKFHNAAHMQDSL